jgi:hypothetical protein
MVRAAAVPAKAKQCPGLRGPHRERNGGIPPTTISSALSGGAVAGLCLSQKDARTDEVLEGVHCKAGTDHGQHPHVARMLDETQHLDALGAFERPLAQFPEYLQPSAVNAYSPS